MKKRGFGRACPSCGRSQYDHPNGKVGWVAVRDKHGRVAGYTRDCDLRLISQETMTVDGKVHPFKVYVPDSAYPRTEKDPRRWAHAINIKAI